jgi:hypothetical protein
VVPARVPLIAPWPTQKNPLHGLHEEDSRADAEPWHDKVVQVTPEDAGQHCEGSTSETISSVRHDIQQRCLTAAQGVQQTFDEDNLQKPTKYPFREL